MKKIYNIILLFLSFFIFSLRGQVQDTSLVKLSIAPMSTTGTTIFGKFSGVSGYTPTGAYTYTVPIEVPEGINGMTPKISLVYNSQSRSGVAGMGCDLVGYSAITRMQKSLYFDGVKKSFDWTSNDAFALDGQRLIEVSRRGDSILYHPENDVSIRVVGYNIKAWGPVIFKVYRKDGTVAQYGHPERGANYTVLESTGGNYYPGQAAMFYAIAWHITTVDDFNSNYIDYYYTGSQASSSGKINYKDLRPVRIEYGNRASDIVVANIIFNYFTNATATSLSYNKLERFYSGKKLDRNITLNYIKIQERSSESNPGTVWDTYQFTYINPSGKFPQLSAITRSSGSSVLKPIKFDWENSVSQVMDLTSEASLVSLPSVGLYSYTAEVKYFPVDFNGDGLLDIAACATLLKEDYKQKDSIYQVGIYLNTGDGYSRPFVIASSFAQPMVFDSDDDGRDELYIGAYTSYSKIYKLSCYEYSGSAFAPNPGKDRTTSLASMGNYSDDYRKRLTPVIANFNGTKTFNYLLVGYRMVYAPMANNDKFILNGFDYNIFFSDINGNGKTDIGIATNTTKFYEWSESSAQFVQIGWTSKITNAYSEVYSGDFNGDGIQDLLVGNPILNEVVRKVKWSLLISDGSNSKADNEEYFPLKLDNVFSETLPDKKKVLITDLDEDGMTDVVFYGENSSNTAQYRYDAYINKGPGYTGSSYFALNSNYSFDVLKKFEYILYDPNGRGTEASRSFIVLSKDYKVRNANIRQSSYKLTNVTNAYGLKNQITYKKIVNPYRIALKSVANGNQSLLYDGVPASFYVVDQVKDDINNTGYAYSYTFSTPRTHVGGRGFLGFLNYKVKNTISGISDEYICTYDQAKQIVYLARQKKTNSLGNLMEETVYKYVVQDKGNKMFFLRLDSLQQSDELKGTSQVTTYTYNALLDPVTITIDYGDNISESQIFTYLTRNGVAKPTRITTIYKAPSTADITRVKDMTYDAKWNLIKEIQDPNNSKKVTTDYKDYTLLGLPQIVETSASGEKKTLRYGYTGHLLTSEQHVNMGIDRTYVYNNKKQLVEEITSQGSTLFEYDDLGRTTKITTPDNRIETHRYNITGLYPEVKAHYQVIIRKTGAPLIYTYYDKHDREVRKLIKNFSDTTSLIKTDYYTNGNVYGVTKPSSDEYAEKYNYDINNRITSIETPLGITRYTYAPKKVTETSPAGTTITEYNGAGWVKSKQTNGKKVTFSYNAAGLPTALTPQYGPTVSMYYDLQGNQIEVYEENRGRYQYIYDGFGRLLHSTSRNGEDQTTYTYRPGTDLIASKTENGIYTSYSYDSRMRLTSVSGGNGVSSAYTYDNLDRIIQKNENIEGKLLTASYAYDANTGKLCKTVYPGDVTVRHTFNGYGTMMSATVQDGSGSQLPVWAGVAHDAEGRWIEVNQGTSANKTTLYTFDPLTGLPTRIQRNGIVDYSYSFNAKGNLEERKDNLTTYKEAFTYDAMNRLTHSKIYRGTTLLKTNTVTYNSQTGNISSKSDIGANPTFYYTANQLKQISSSTGLDSKLSDQQLLRHTAFNKVSKVTEGTLSLDLTYGADNERRKSIGNTDSTGYTNTRYYFGNYEENSVSSKKLYYIYADSRLVGIYEKKSSGSFLYHATVDYQGSLLALTNANGTVKEKYAYDAWGLRRSPTNWSLRDSRKSFVTNRGYTMHEHIEGMRLINMNGRIYDPLLAMFITPDPYVVDAGNWLDYNPYSYCRNNPFIYTDPSGEWIQFAIAGVIGAVMNVANNWDKISKNPWSAVGYALSGAGGGIISVINPAVGAAFTAAGNLSTDICYGNVPEFNSIADAVLYSAGSIAGAVSTTLVANAASQWLSKVITNIDWSKTGFGKKGVRQFLGFFDDMNNYELHEVVYQETKAVTKEIAKTASNATSAAMAKGGTQTVYRVFGGEAKALGKSWTPVNPGNIVNYRNVAGLPNVNTGQFIIEGTVKKSNILLQRGALPLDGNTGGVMEYIIKDPTKIKIKGIWGVNPSF